MASDNVARRSTAADIVRVLIVFDAVATLFAGIVHFTGANIPLGFAVFAEPPLLPAGIVESLIGLTFVVAAYVVLSGKSSAWGWALGAHLFAIAGFLLGIWSTRNGTTPFNHEYHFVMLAVFVVGLALLLVPGTREGLGRARDG